MKKSIKFLPFILVLLVCACFTFVACNGENDDKGKLGSTDPSKVLVAYFSATGNTKGVAEKIADIADGTLYEIVPQVPYTAADLDYNSDCRANTEQRDDAARPAITGRVENMAEYDVIYLGYPI